METEKENKARKFLLGKLTGEETIKIEEGYFNDKNLFEEILIAENDLIDAYAADSLSTEDKRRFEGRLLLSPQQRQRVEFAKILVKYASSQFLSAENLNSSPAKSSGTSIMSRLFANKPMLSLAFAAAILIFFVGGIWLTVNKQNSQIDETDEFAKVQTPQQAPVQEKPVATGNNNQIIESKPEISPSPVKSNRQKTPQPKREMPPKKETPAVFSLILSPGLTRAAGTSRVFTIPAKTDFVKMQLKFEQGDFSSYHAALETVEGNQIWRSKNLKAQKGERAITVSIPSKLLKKGDYIITLKGMTEEKVYENVESYAFTINP